MWKALLQWNRRNSRFVEANFAGFSAFTAASVQRLWPQSRAPHYSAAHDTTRLHASGTGHFSALCFCHVLQTHIVRTSVAQAYQFNGSHFVLQDSSTAGELSEAGVSGSHAARTGWESTKSRFRWEGGEGDWPTKYAPWGLGDSGPRGLTPPAALWVLSADSFYYGTLYMLSQLTLNTQGVGEHANCWEWEFDAIEGLIGTVPRGHPLPGNINQLYVTATAQVSGCMPMPGTAAQDNGYARRFSQPQNFQSFCEQNPLAVGCRPWTAEGADIWHGGGYRGTDRFENAENTPYVFAVAGASEVAARIVVTIDVAKRRGC